MLKNESIKNEYMVALNSILINKNNIDIAYYEIHKMKLTQLLQIFAYLNINACKIVNDKITTGNRFTQKNQRNQQINQDIICTYGICLDFDIVKKFNVIQFLDKLMFDNGSNNFLNINNFHYIHYNSKTNVQHVLHNLQSQYGINYTELNDNQIDEIFNDLITCSLVNEINNITIKLHDFCKTNEYLNKLNVSTFFLDNDYSDCVINICKLVEIKNIVLKEVETILKDIFMVEFNIEDIKLKTGSEITELLTDKIKIVNLIIRGLYIDMYKLN